MAAQVYSGAYDADAGQDQHRKKFKDDDKTKGYPFCLVWDQENFPHGLTGGHANISGQSNTITQEKVNAQLPADHMHSVLLRGPHVALEGISRASVDGRKK